MASRLVTPSGDPPQSRVTDLARSGRVSGVRAVGKGVEVAANPESQGQSKGRVWVVDGWTAGDQKKVVQRHQIKSNNINNSSSSSSSSGSFSGGSSDSSSGDTTSGGSLGCGRLWARSEDSVEGLCYCCMCSKTHHESVTTKPTKVDARVLPGKRPLGVNRRTKCLNAISLKEDNARFILLALLLLIYMLIGAVVFEVLEGDYEKSQRNDYISRYFKSLNELKQEIAAQNVSMTRVEDLMYVWGNMTGAGIQLHGRLRWDYAGSFHFVYTVVSTIGYGAAAPRTLEGKIFCIAYGLIGCSCGILFFNLFLERIITLLAFVMRRTHEMKQRIKDKKTKAAGVVQNGKKKKLGSQDSMDDAWKPSVYWVMFYLSIASVIVASLGALMFMEVEEWSYTDAIYFCFVSFATIGFGDFVSAQEPNDFYGSSLYIYRFFNFFVLVVGCCCIYSLFNVISIIIKQLLNFIIKKVAIWCTEGCRSGAVSPPNQPSFILRHMLGDFDSVYNSDMERKLSGEMVSMREYFSTNKTSILFLPRIQEEVSLAVMQKQLYETAQLGRGQPSASHQKPTQEEHFTPGQVGPLAIASSKLFEGHS